MTNLKIFQILGGIFVGVIGSQLFLRNSSPAVLAEPIVCEKPAVVSRKAASSPTPAKILSAQARDLKPTQIKPTSLPPEPSIQTTPVSEGDITFSEVDVQAMEYDWEDLPRQVQAQREQRGWRMIFVEPQSVFARSGLRANDLVTQESLDENFGMLQNRIWPGECTKFLSTFQNSDREV